MDYREAMAEAPEMTSLRFDECEFYWWSDIESYDAFGAVYITALLTCMRTGADERRIVAVQFGDNITPNTLYYSTKTP